MPPIATFPPRRLAGSFSSVAPYVIPHPTDQSRYSRAAAAVPAPTMAGTLERTRFDAPPFGLGLSLPSLPSLDQVSTWLQANALYVGGAVLALALLSGRGRGGRRRR